MAMVTIRTLAELSPAEVSLGEAKLAEILGADPPLRIAARLCLSSDGEWLLSYRELRCSKADMEHPGMGRRSVVGKVDFDPAAMSWADIEWPLSDFMLTKHAAIPVVLGLLASPDNPEAEIDRLERLLAQHQIWAAAQRNETVAADERRAREEDLLRKKRVEFRADAWTATPPLAQALHLVAMAINDGKDVPGEIHALAVQVGRGDVNFHGFPFPARKWWA